MNRLFRFCSVLSAFFSSLVFAGSAPVFGGIMTFEESVYTPGTSIVGKADPAFGATWVGGFSQAIVGTSTSPANQFFSAPATPLTAGAANARLSPTAVGLGGSNAASGTYTFSFDLRSLAPPSDTTNNFNRVGTVYIGNTVGTPAIRLDLLVNGFVQFYNGATATNSTVDGTSGGTRFDIDTVNSNQLTLAGEIRFDTNQYTLAINGISQNGGNPINFRNNGPFASFGDFAIESPVRTAAEWRQFGVDNVNISAVPEPTTLLLVATAGSAGLFRQIRRKRRLVP